MDNSTEKLKRGQNIAIISSLVSLFLALLKGIVGFLFGSQLLIADAFHSGADLLTQIAKDHEQIESVFIHIEPLKDETVTAIVPVQDINGMDSLVSDPDERLTLLQSGWKRGLWILKMFIRMHSSTIKDTLA